MTGLYVHVPFCRAKCRYCDFQSSAVGADGVFAASGLEARYLDALAVEAASRGAAQKIFGTVYVGGGTPSVLSAAGISRLFDILRRSFEISPAAEITFECNPESISVEKLRALAGCGVTRISLGAQSFDDETLKFLGRAHSVRDTVAAVARARSAGFRDIGIDLIFGSPRPPSAGFAASMKKWRGDLGHAVSLAPEHISVYALSVEKGTPLADAGVEISGDEQADMYDAAGEFLRARGYAHYEISNFAVEGRESRHNMNYWRGGGYVGLGPAAASFDGSCRFKNTPSMEEYLSNPAGCVAESRRLTEDELASEKIFLGLRMLREGAPVVGAAARRFAGVIERLKKEGAVSFYGGRLRLSPSAAFISNAIMSEFVI